MTHRFEINAGSRPELIATLRRLLSDATAEEHQEHGLRLVEGSGTGNPSRPLPKTRAELTLAIIAILGPHHRALALHHPELWTRAPVAADAALEALESAEAILADLNRPASILD